MLPGSLDTAGKRVLVASVAVTLGGYLKKNSLAQEFQPLEATETGFYAIIQEHILTEEGR